MTTTTDLTVVGSNTFDECIEQAMGAPLRAESIRTVYDWTAIPPPPQDVPK